MSSEVLQMVRNAEEFRKRYVHNIRVLKELARRGTVKENGDGTFDLKE